MKTPVDLYISPGNRKMNLPTWSLPAKQTCPGCTKLCSSKCYARKAELAYPQVLPSRKRNFKATKQDLFVQSMVANITHKNPKWFRIHESGDFYNQAYVDKWFEICRALPQVKFLAFTKSFHLDFSNAPENLSLVWSIFPDSNLDKVPQGPRAYAGTCGPADTFECPGNCDSCLACWSLAKRGIDVHFTIH